MASMKFAAAVFSVLAAVIAGCQSFFGNPVAHITGTGPRQVSGATPAPTQQVIYQSPIPFCEGVEQGQPTPPGCPTATGSAQPSGGATSSSSSSSQGGHPSASPTPPAPTGYTPYGSASIQVITTPSTDDGVFNLAVNFTGGLGVPDIINLVRGFNPDPARYPGYDYPGFWHWAGYDVPGAPKPAQKIPLFIRTKEGESFLLATEPIGDIYTDPFSQRVTIYQNATDYDLGIAFRYDPIGKVWTQVGTPSTYFQSFNSKTAWDDKTVWKDFRQKFFSTIMGDPNYQISYSVARADIPGHIWVQSAEGTADIDIGDLAVKSGLWSAGNVPTTGDLSLRLAEDTYARCLHYANEPGDCYASDYELQYQVREFTGGNLIHAKRGWAWIAPRNNVGEGTPGYDKPFASFPLWVQRSGETTWTKTTVSVQTYGWIQGWTGYYNRGTQHVLQEVPGGQLSPFGNKDVIVYSGPDAYYGDLPDNGPYQESDLVIDEETLFK